MNRLLALLASIVTTYASFAQNVTGRIVDENDRPVEFVNVVLLTRNDSTYIAGTVTRQDGSFLLENPQMKSAFVKLSSIGYITQTKTIPPTGHFGTITMSLESVMLGEVVVKSNRPVTAIKGNALVTNIDNSVLAHAGTANDVLTQIPMVLGRDGHFEVFGKGSPLIYINGRKVQDLTELSQLNSSDIKNVEVITNPGARYDASVKSVIRISTKRPQGDGWSGTLRTQNGFRHFFGSRNQANLKFRTGGLEIFANGGYLSGKFQVRSSNNMLTRGSSLMDQRIESEGKMRNNEFYGKVGFSYLFNENHSIGAYYLNGFNKQTEQGDYHSQVSVDDVLTDEITSFVRNKYRNHPEHSTNFYYNGLLGNLGIDFNIDYMQKDNRADMLNDERGSASGKTVINSFSNNHNRLFAQKLILSYSLWKGKIEMGDEFTSSRFTNLYNTDAAQVNDATSQVSEKNISGFVQIMQKLGKFDLSAGVRYEHVNFNYLENGQLKADQSKTYSNLFPSLSVSTMLRDLQLAFSYTHKTQRPSYADLDGTMDYINRFILEGGNPFLKPEKIHTLELMGTWHQFFANAIHLPGDIWFNVDMQWMSEGNDKNAYLKSSSYLNVKFYKAFCNSRFSVTLAADDIFNKSGRDFTFYNEDVVFYKLTKSNNRSFQLTLQYNFNTTRDRYKGSGAGQSEKSRF